MPWGLFDHKQVGSGDWSGFLEKGVEFEGRLTVPGTLRVDCVFRGDLACGETFIVGEHAVVNGEIKAESVVIGGRLDGVVNARGRVEIQTKAIVTGDIHTPCLVVEPGASFEGRCHIVNSKDASKPITIPVRSAVAPS